MLVTAVYAYLASLPSLPPLSGPKVTVTSSPLEFSMGLDKTDFLLGENVTIHFSLENISNETKKLAWLNDYCGWYFDYCVMDENNTVVYHWVMEYGCYPMIVDKVLDSGENISNTYVWHQTLGYPSYSQVPCGIYSVKGLTLPLILDDQSNIITIETPTITFTIA